MKELEVFQVKEFMDTIWPIWYELPERKRNFINFMKKCSHNLFPEYYYREKMDAMLKQEEEEEKTKIDEDIDKKINYLLISLWHMWYELSGDDQKFQKWKCYIWHRFFRPPITDYFDDIN